MVKGAEYTIFKRGEDGKRGIIIEKYTDLQIEFRWTEPSKFSISSLGSSRIPLTIGNGIDVYRNGELFLTGVVETAEESCDEMQHGVITWRVEGRDISSLLDRRLLLPDPVGLDFSESVQDVITDSVAGAIKRYVERNGGVSAATGRRLGNLTMEAQEPDPNGDTYAYRLQPLSKVCAEIGAGEAIPVIECDPETGLMELKVATRRERADSVIFSPENGTITRWSKTRKLPKVNSLWAMSGGEEQIVTHSQNEGSIAAFGAFEGFIKDSAQVQEATEDKPAVTAVDVVGILEKKSADKLNKEAATESYSVDICESPALRFVDDWLCGDRVTCVIDGEEIVSTIESVSVSVNSTAEKVSAKIGAIERGIFAELFAQITQLQERLEMERVTVGGGGGAAQPAYEYLINGDTVALTLGMVVAIKPGAADTVVRTEANSGAIGVVADDSIAVGVTGRIATKNGLVAQVAADEGEISAGDALTTSATAGKAKAGTGGSPVGTALENKADGIIANVKSLLGFLNSGGGSKEWWLPDGIVASNVIAAYQFKGATTEGGAIQNLNNPSAYMLSKTGSTVTWNASTGFYIPATAQAGLNAAGITSFSDVVVRFSDNQNVNAHTGLIGAANGYLLMAKWGGRNPLVYEKFPTFYSETVEERTKYRIDSFYETMVLGWARNNSRLYANGISHSPVASSSIWQYGANFYGVTIGQAHRRNNDGVGTPAFSPVNIQAVVFYNTNLTDQQHLAVATAMNEL